MKKWAIGLVLAMLVFGFCGCKDDTKEKSRRLIFVNNSNHEVEVISLSTEWQGFMLPVDEKRTLNDITNVDYVFEPADKVQEGSASTERYIVFVNTPPEEVP